MNDETVDPKLGDQNPKTVRCKFRCNSMKQYLDGSKNKMLYSYEFSVVYNGSPENEMYFAYTPSGTLTIGAFNDKLFEPGKEYYIDVTLALPVPA